MPKQAIVGSFVLLVALIAIVAYALFAPIPAATTTPSTPPSLTTDGKYTEAADYYTIAVNYPTTTPLEATANTAAVASIDTWVADQVAQFKTDGKFSTMTAADAQNMGISSTTKESLQIEYLIASSPNTVSYIFNTEEDTLGAHPNEFFKTFTFNTSTGAELALSDLFAPGSDYLDQLSSIARANLPAVIGGGADASMIASGTTASDGNFSSFFFDNSDFVILFPPYQVAAYSSGPQTLRIPVSSLDSILQSDYQQN